MWDELNEPLGFGALAAPPVGRARVSGLAVAAAAAVALAIGLLALGRRDAPLGGEPFAVAKVEVLPAPPKPAPPKAAKLDVSVAAPESAAPPAASAAQVEAVSGVKVARGSGDAAPKALIIDVARALAAQHAATQPNP